VATEIWVYFLVAASLACSFNSFRIRQFSTCLPFVPVLTCFFANQLHSLSTNTNQINNSDVGILACCHPKCVLQY
jgi:hypothetical protein